jgi:hypothetical protein
MPSSNHSRTPRLANVRTNSNASIHIDRDVKVTPRSAHGSNTRATYSTMSSAPNGHDRAQSSQGPVTATASVPVLNRWKSLSKLSDTSRFTPQRAQNSLDLGSNKEGMRALAEFLMRTEPPPSNFMSRPESDAGSVHSTKKPAFKIFGRQKTKKAVKGPKLLQLPDSAVAATTTNGARHIAISIPIEYDYPYHDAPAQSSAPSRLHSQSKMPGERGPVTVLKPVVEVWESGSSCLTKTEDMDKLKAERVPCAESVETPAADVLGLETTRTLENYYTQLNRKQRNRPKSSNVDGILATKPEATTTHKRYIAVSPVNVARQGSTGSDSRHSGGTAYSIASVVTYPAHSRDPSSASSAPSATTTSRFKLEPPPRKSSTTKISPGVQAELAKAYLLNKTPSSEDARRSSFLSDNTSSTARDSTIIATAETAQNYTAAAGIQTISRSDTPNSSHPMGPAPTRQLPDVPESPCIPSFLPSPSPPISRKSSPTIGMIDDTLSKAKSAPAARSTAEAPRQSRQDRVKARKQRDMALHRDKSTSNEKTPLTENVSSTNPQILVTTAPKSAKRRDESPEAARKRGLNSITDIMLVAELAPYTGVVKVEDLPFGPKSERAKKKRTKDSDSNGSISAQGTHTPPSSAESESDPIFPNRRAIQSRGSSKNLALDARRQERRVKRNMSLREKEMDARLVKLERDNTMLMLTLSGIATSFGELSKVLPRTNMQLKEPGLLTDVGMEMRDGGEEDGVHDGSKNLESVMKQLKSGAPEFHKRV